MAARNGKCFHTVERHGKGIAHANHLPTVWGQCPRSEEHTSELQSQSNFVCRLLLERKNLASHFFDLLIRKILTSRLILSKHLAHILGTLLLLGKIGVFHNRRNASSRLLLVISKHLILCIYLVFRILA